MAILFFDTKGVVHLEFLPRRQTMDTDVWIAILNHLKDSIRRKRPVMWKGGFDGQTDRDFILHMDNAPCHVSVPALAYYGENDIDLLSHPAYSPDLAPCNFWAFPSLKGLLRDRKFPSVEALQTEIRRLLRATPVAEFEQALYDMAVRWSKCVEARGEYFEGTNVNFNPAHLPQDSSSESENNAENSSQDDDSD